METYQAKNINKEDIDNIVKVIYNKFEERKLNKKDDTNNVVRFNYLTPFITLNNIKFRFNIVCFYKKENNKEDWLLHYIFNDDIYIFVEGEDISINHKYFKSNTLRELIENYTNSKFVYDKYDNKIMRYDDYLEEEYVRKLFHSNIECCVCYDNLSGDFKTKCGHYLCLECYSQFKGKKKCPMCKACLCCGEQEECDDDDDY